MYGTLTYQTWSGIKNRCSPKAREKDKKYYFDRGIGYTHRWDKFENFLEDMGIKPDGLEIDRIDGNKGYCKENCRWTTKSINNRNRIIYNKKSKLPRGVYRSKNNTFYVQITINGKIECLGCFKTIKEAQEIYLLAYKNYFNELPPEYINKEY